MAAQHAPESQQRGPLGLFGKRTRRTAQRRVTRQTHDRYRVRRTLARTALGEGGNQEGSLPDIYAGRQGTRIGRRYGITLARSRRRLVCGVVPFDLGRDRDRLVGRGLREGGRARHRWLL